METRHPTPALRFRAGACSPDSRVLPAEVAVALTYDGSTRAVMMATPADLEDFARGFTLTEGIATRDEILSIEPVETPQGIDLRIWLAPAASAREATRRRSMAGPVGCGLCGLDSLAEAMRPTKAVTSGFSLTARQVLAAVAALEGHQPLHDATRAAHGAAFWQGAITLSREDVGRHNALDKLIGALTPEAAAQGAVVLTCRISIDMVQKACAAGVPVLIGTSAPTAAAVQQAEAAGLTLIGLARPDGFEVFTHPHRITGPEAAHVA